MIVVISILVLREMVGNLLFAFMPCLGDNGWCSAVANFRIGTLTNITMEQLHIPTMKLTESVYSTKLPLLRPYQWRPLGGVIGHSLYLIDPSSPDCFWRFDTTTVRHLIFLLFTR
jgi:hypothetical protein